MEVLYSAGSLFGRLFRLKKRQQDLGGSGSGAVGAKGGARSRQWRRLLGAALAAGSLAAWAQTAQAQFQYTDNGDGTCTITSFDDSTPTADIPASISGLRVVAIGPQAFQGSAVASVTMPDGVTSIGYAAFSGCELLTNLVLSGSVTNLGAQAFLDCAGLQQVALPAGLVSIGSGTFGLCISLSALEIPASVSSIAGDAFAGCTSLQAITVDAANSHYSSVNGVLFDQPQTYLMVYPPAKAGASYAMPASVTNMAASAFAHATGLTSLTLAEGLAAIPDSAFYGCSSLVSLTLPTSISSIGSQAFYTCSQLAEVDLPYGLRSIGSQAFSGCNALTSLVLPNTVTNLGAAALMSCQQLTQVTLSTNLTTLAAETFESCPSLGSLVIPSRVASIGGDAFYLNTSLRSLYYEGPPPSLGSSVFVSVTNLTHYYLADSGGWGATFAGFPTQPWESLFGFTTNAVQATITGYLGTNPAVAIPDRIDGLPVTDMGDQAFYEANITSVTIPATMTNIGLQAMGECRNLASVVLPEGVQNISHGAFYDCGSLTRIQLPESVVSIGGFAFYSTGLTNISIPVGATFPELYNHTFDSCTNLLSATVLCDAVPDGCFDGCGSLTSVVLSGRVTRIESYAFSDCEKLPGLTLPEGLLDIGAHAFQWCYGLTNLIIPNSVTNIDEDAFGYCGGLTNVQLGSNVVTLGASVFEYCTQLQRVTLPGKLTAIPLYAFWNCTSLVTVTVPASVSVFDPSAFGFCDNFRSCFFQGNAPTLTQSGMSGTVYYLPGTTGWGSSFGGAPAVLWAPRAVAPVAGAGQFSFSISGPPYASVAVDAATNLAAPLWLPLATNSLSASGASFFTDPAAGAYPSRYYRFRAP